MYGQARSYGQGFSRTNYNYAKRGAYYTDVRHMQILKDLFSYTGGVCLLEPSIGDGSAVKALTQGDPVKIFGVEIDRAVALKTAEGIEECVNADFTNGVVISNNAFSMCFGNPPYMDDMDAEGGKRLEKTFLEKVTMNYLKRGGILVWVIPYRVICETGYVRYLMRHYERLALFRFQDDEYKKWGQVVFVGRKKAPQTPTPEELMAEITLFYAKEELVPILPDTFQGTPLYRSIEVEPSDESDVKRFCSVEFDPEAARECIAKADLSDYRQIVSRKLTQVPFASQAVARPPITPNNDIQYLRAVNGEGQGRAGEEGEDLHLQRGVAEVVEDISYKEGGDGSEVMVVTSHTAISMTTIETDGRITTLT